MAAVTSDWLRDFRLLLWIHLTEFTDTLTGRKISKSSSKFVFFGPIRKARWSSWPLIGCGIFHFSSEPLNGIQRFFFNIYYGQYICISTSPLKKLNRIQRNVTGSKISTSFTKFVLFWWIGNTRWSPLPLIDRDIFDFSSKNAEQNSLQPDRKQYLSVLYLVCIFRPTR